MDDYFLYCPPAGSRIQRLSSKPLSIQTSSDNLRSDDLNSTSETSGDIIIDFDDDGKFFLCGVGLNFKNTFIDKAAQTQQIDF